MIIYQSENIGKSFDYRSNSHENWVVPPHIHEYYEIAFTMKGDTCVYVDGKKYIVKENHLIFISPNQIHEYSNEASSFMRCAVFSSDLVPVFHQKVMGMIFQDPVFDFSSNSELLYELHNTSPSKIIKICGLLNLITDFVLERGALIKKNKSGARYNNLQDIISYISSNFRDNIQLSDISKISGYHEKYLSSTLHSLTGMNFRSFLSLYRIDYAKKLLKSNNSALSISEIAMECGFSSINTFNRMFLKLTGTTPSEYRASKKAMWKFT